MCSRVFLSGGPGVCVACRSVDWYVSDEPVLWALPSGLERDGGAVDGALTWTSRHPSVVLSGWDALTSEGVNGAGLAAHVLLLEASAWEAPDARPAVGNLMWAQWVLDTCATVDEVLEAMRHVRLADVPVRGMSLGVHLAVEDRHGAAAVIEVLADGVAIHEGRDARVVTNDPPLSQQLEGLAAFRAFGGHRDLPGDVDAISRFVRGTYFLDHLPEPDGADQALAGVVGVVRSMSVPFGAPSEPFGTYPTWWLSATDLANGRLIFQSTLSPFALWLDVDDAVARARDAGPLAIDPTGVGLAGDVIDLLRPMPLPY